MCIFEKYAVVFGVEVELKMQAEFCPKTWCVPTELYIIIQRQKYESSLFLKPQTVCSEN